MKNSVQELNIKFELAEKRISIHENRLIEIIQVGRTDRKKINKNEKASETYGIDRSDYERTPLSPHGAPRPTTDPCL